MKIFSTHRKKLEPRRRFGGREFRDKIQQAQNYKRYFEPNPQGLYLKIMSKIGLRSKFWRTIVYALLLMIFYYLVISNYFLITNVQVSGNVQVPTDQIQQVFQDASKQRIFLIPQNHYLLMSKSHATKLLTQSIPTIKAITTFKRIWPNGAAIEVLERSPGFIFKANNLSYLVDDEGLVVKEQQDSKNLPVVEDQVVENVALGEQFPNAKLAAFIISMQKQWNSKINSGISVIKIPGKATSEVEFVSIEGWTVFFDITRPVSEELSSLALILGKLVPNQNRSQLAYIDLRLATRAYLCFKNSPCAAIPQQAGDNPNAK